jgi:hypothetical protein
MKVLVVSYKHGLLPYAWRLQREGCDVETVVVRERYRRAWSGLLDVRGSIDDVVDARERVLVTDSSLAIRKLSGVALRVFGFVGSAEDLGGYPYRLAAWFNGEELSGYHAWFPELGVAAGGLGKRCVSAGLLSGTAALAEQARNALEPRRDEIKASGHRGLVWLADGALQGGWSFLHAHLFVGEQSLQALIEGGAAVAPQGWICGVVVSVPPWPLECNLPSAPAVLEGWNDEDQRAVFFHDISVDPAARAVRVGGTDGLVGVVRGVGLVPELARARALSIVGRLALPEAQVRPDVGAKLAAVLHNLGV